MKLTRGRELAIFATTTIIVFVLACVFMIQHARPRAKAEEEGIWLARYLGVADRDLSVATRMMREDNRETAFLRHWHIVENVAGYPDAIIAWRDAVPSYGHLVIGKDLRIEWRVDLPGLRMHKQFNEQRRIRRDGHPG